MEDGNRMVQWDCLNFLDDSTFKLENHRIKSEIASRLPSVFRFTYLIWFFFPKLWAAHDSAFVPLFLLILLHMLAPSLS